MDVLAATLALGPQALALLAIGALVGGAAAWISTRDDGGEVEARPRVEATSHVQRRRRPYDWSAER